MLQFKGNTPKTQRQSVRNKRGGYQQEENKEEREGVQSCERIGSSWEWESLQGKINRWTRNWTQQMKVRGTTVEKTTDKTFCAYYARRQEDYL